MTNQSQEYEYLYQSSQESNHHVYLKKPILDLLADLSVSPPLIQKRRKFMF